MNRKEAEARIFVSLIVFHVGLLMAAAGVLASLFILPSHIRFISAAIFVLIGSFLMLTGYKIGKRK